MEPDDGDDAGGIHTRLPRALGERIDRLQKYSDEGIVSRKAFIAEAVREKLERTEAKVRERAGLYDWLEELAWQGKKPGPGRRGERG